MRVFLKSLGYVKHADTPMRFSRLSWRALRHILRLLRIPIELLKEFRESETATCATGPGDADAWLDSIAIQREPLDCLSPGSPYEQVVLVWASQCVCRNKTPARRQANIRRI